MNQNRDSPDDVFVGDFNIPPDLDDAAIEDVGSVPYSESNTHDGAEFRSAAIDVAMPEEVFHSASPAVDAWGCEAYDIAETSKDKFGVAVGGIPYPPSEVPVVDSTPDQLKLLLPNKWQHKTTGNLEKVPTFYPMEQTNICLPITDFTEGTMLSDIVCCFKEMSVQAVYFDDPVAVALLTPENVEMYLSFWKDKTGEQVIVEIQRRRGCSVTFHKYANHMLDAAANKFNVESASEFERASQDIDLASMKKAEHMLYGEVAKNVNKHKEESVVAIEIGYELLTKERIDARLLGLESIYLLTNPRRTAFSTTVMASKAVLLGVGPEPSDPTLYDSSPFRGIRDVVLNIICFKSLGDDNFGKEEMDMESDSDEEDFFEADGDASEYPPHLKDTLSVMFNLALSILANALEVIGEVQPDSISSFMAYVAEYGGGRLDILTVLLNEISRAEKKPHNASVTCRSLRFMCKNNKKAIRKVQENVKDVTRAYDVGSKTHRRLENEALQLWKLLYGQD